MTRDCRPGGRDPRTGTGRAPSTRKPNPIRSRGRVSPRPSRTAILCVGRVNGGMGTEGGRRAAVPMGRRSSFLVKGHARARIRGAWVALGADGGARPMGIGMPAPAEERGSSAPRGSRQRSRGQAGDRARGGGGLARHAWAPWGPPSLGAAFARSCLLGRGLLGWPSRPSSWVALLAVVRAAFLAALRGAVRARRLACALGGRLLPLRCCRLLLRLGHDPLLLSVWGRDCSAEAAALRCETGASSRVTIGGVERRQQIAVERLGQAVARARSPSPRAPARPPRRRATCPPAPGGRDRARSGRPGGGTGHERGQQLGRRGAEAPDVVDASRQARAGAASSRVGRPRPRRAWS